MLTLNQIHAQIVALANAHYQIAEVGMGTIAELQGKPDRNYPLLWLSNEGGSVEGNYKVDNIRLTMFGRVIVGEEGQDDDASEIEVLSDMQLILLDFLNYFHQQHGQEYVTDKAATLEHFTERTNDRTAGYSCVLELKQFYDWNKCQIPQSGAVIPPTIDGLTLYDFCDQSVLDRLTAEQIACLETEFGQCADATVEINNTLFDTVASGATIDIPVINGGSNPVGSLQGSDWVIGNNMTTINGTQVTDQEAEVNAAIFATLDGSQSGSWNAGTQTWEMTSAPCADATVQLNGTTVGTIPSGDSDSFTVNLDGSPSGSWDGTAWQVTSPPCDDATIELNGVEMTTIPSGDTENISVRQSSGATEVGSKQGVHWRIDDSAISINGSPVADVKAEDPLDIDVTQDGLPVGSWNGSEWVIPTCPPVPSLAVAVSNATPVYGSSISITATPTNFTPTNYIFFAYNGSTIQWIADQAGAVASWVVNVKGSYSVYVIAKQGTTSAWTVTPSAITPVIDADADAFLNAALITDFTISKAVNTLVLQFKADSIWSKFNAIYPFVGGNASAHKFNLKNPLNTDAAFRLVFYGGWSHDGNGVQTNGVNSYADTFLTASTTSLLNNEHLSVYSRTDSNGLITDIGADQSPKSHLYARYTNIFYPRLQSAFGGGIANTDSRGLFVVSRIDGATVSGFKNTTKTDFALTNAGRPTIPYFIGAYNNSGTAANYSNRQYAFATIGEGLSDAQELAMYTAIQAFQTTLSRQV